MSENKAISLSKNPDSWDWAREFCNTLDKLDYYIATPTGVMSRSELEGWMISWFANAMMAMHDYIEMKNRQNQEALYTEQARYTSTDRPNGHLDPDGKYGL